MPLTKPTSSALQRLADVDAKLFLQVNRIHNYLRLERLVRAVSFTGDGHCYVLLALLLPLFDRELSAPKYPYPNSYPCLFRPRQNGQDAHPESLAPNHQSPLEPLALWQACGHLAEC